MFYAKLFVSIKKKEKKEEQLDDDFRHIRDMHSSFFILFHVMANRLENRKRE